MSIPPLFKIHVSMILHHEGKILLVQESKKEILGKWNLPGGHVETGEKLIDAIVREVLEETGCQTVCQNLIGVYPTNTTSGHHFIRFVFSGEITGLQGKPTADDVFGMAWKTPEEISGLSKQGQLLGEKIIPAILSDFEKNVFYPLEVVRER